MRAYARRRRSEVDRPEHQHPRCRCEGLNEDPQALASACAIRSIGEHLGLAVDQQTPCVVADGVVDAAAAE
jgi:hypothetical protein